MTPLLDADVFGHGDNVLLLHGLPSPAGDMAALGRALVPQRRCVVPSLLGYGASPAPASADSIEENALAIEELVGRVQASRCFIVGYSMGAFRALQLARRGVLDVRGVVLLSPFIDLSPEERQGMRDFAAALRSGVDLRSALGPRFLSNKGQTDASLVATVESWLALAPPAVVAQELDDIASVPPLLPTLTELRCKVAIRVGEADLATPPERARAVAAAIPGSTLEIVPDVAHAVLLEDLDATARAVSGWLAGW